MTPDPWAAGREQMIGAALLSYAEYELLGLSPAYEQALQQLADLVPMRRAALDALLLSRQRAALGQYDDVADRLAAVEMLGRDVETAVSDLMTARAATIRRQSNDR